MAAIAYGSQSPSEAGYSSPPDVAELIYRLIESAADPERGGELYDLHSDLAPLCFEGRLDARARISRDAFIEEHASAENRPRPIWLLGVHPLSQNVDAEGRIVAWLSARDLAFDRPVFVAAGLAYTEEGWGLGWAVLSDRRQPWSFDDGMRQTLAELAFLELPGGVRARTLLEASHARLFLDDKRPLLLMPGMRFSCHGSGACCRHEYGINLPARAQSLIDAMPWERIRPALKGTQIPVLPDGQLRLKEQHEPCRFLDEKKQCLIHRELGRQPFSACAVFPMSFAETPEGIAVVSSSLCGSVRHHAGLPLERRQGELRFRLAQAPVRRTDVYRLRADLEVSWESFRDAEAALRGLLEREDVPIHRRLYLGSRLLEVWPTGKREIDPTWDSEPLPNLDATTRDTVITFVSRILQWERVGLRQLPERGAVELRHNTLREPQVLVELLQGLHFSKVYSYPYDLTTAHNFAILTYTVALYLQAHFEGLLPDLQWQELATFGSHGLLRSLLPDEAPAAVRNYYGMPEFGMMVLGLPA